MDCALLAIDEPGIANVSLRVLPVAMNDEGCTTFLCIADNQQHGYGLGNLVTPGFNDTRVAFLRGRGVIFSI